MKKILLLLTVIFMSCSTDDGNTPEKFANNVVIRSSDLVVKEQCGADCVKVSIEATLYNNTLDVDKGRLIYIIYNGDNPNTLIFSNVFTVPKKQEFKYSELVTETIRKTALESGIDEVIFEKESLIQN